jgi:hypothetical protein
MGLRIIAYPAFRDAAGGDGFAADCLVSQGVGLKSLRICSFLARRNSLIVLRPNSAILTWHTTGAFHYFRPSSGWTAACLSLLSEVTERLNAAAS